MEYEQGLKKLRSIHQVHLLDHWSSLSLTQQQELLSEIDSLDIETFFEQKRIYSLFSSFFSDKSLEPFVEYEKIGNPIDVMTGRQLLTNGNVGCLLVAGGQSSRFQANGLKALVPITVIKHKSLLQLFAEKTLAASKQANFPLKLAIMASTGNQEIFRRFFQDHHFFGLKPEQIAIFTQGNLPFLDDQGNLFLEDRSKISQAPNGNGSSLYHFWKSGIGSQWQSEGIEYLNFVQIDNPLADPFDAELIGFHHRHQHDVTIKCTPRRDNQEKVGVLVKKEGKIAVVEYLEISEEERMAINPDHSLKHYCANISLFCFNLNFIKHFELNKIKLPLHMIKKPAKSLDSPCLPAWKFEYFIFDLLSFTSRVGALLYPRQSCFAPLKNLAGEDSLSHVQAALQESDRRILSHITGKSLTPETSFELAQEFYYPTEELLTKWKNKSIDFLQDYIEP